MTIDALQSVEDRVAEITERLRDTYGHRPRGRILHPTDELIATILSQHTADRNSHAAYARLKDTYPTWEAIQTAPEGELAETIRSAGLANIKARRIKAMLDALETRFGTLDLSFLAGLPTPEARRLLTDLPGVGPKTAACVLLFSLDKPALPVDTHVHRVSRRLGLIGPRDSAERAHDILEALVPPADVYDFHVNLIAHGRQICGAEHPRCAICPLNDLCPYTDEHSISQETAQSRSRPVKREPKVLPKAET